MVAGASSSLRTGLRPQIESDIYPGLHLKGRFLLNALTDIAVIKDIGFSVLYERSFALQYKSKQSQNHVDAQQQHLRLELLYKLSFRSLATSPTFLVRIGYGDLKHTIQSSAENARSARYNYLAAMLQYNMWFARPWLGIFVGGGYLGKVDLADKLTGTATGFMVNAGLYMEPVKLFHISLGYELSAIQPGRKLSGKDDR